MNILTTQIGAETVRMARTKIIRVKMMDGIVSTSA